MPDDRHGTEEQAARGDGESGAPAPGTWPGPGSWDPGSTWQQPSAAWQQPCAAWQGPGAAWQGPGAWQGPAQWQQPGFWLSPFASVAAAWQVPWSIGSVPWGYANPPAVPPVLEPPGNFHPPISRPVLSLKGRASPRLFGLGVFVGLPAMVALLAYVAGAGAGYKLPAGPVPRWLALEGICLAAGVGLIAWAVAQARQRRADGWRDYAGPSPLLTLGALLAVLTALQIPLQSGLDAAGVDLDSGLATFLLMVLFLSSYVGVVHFLAVRPGSLSWRDIARPGRLAPSSDDWLAAAPVPGWGRRWGETVGSWRSRLSGSQLGDLLIPLAMVIPLLVVSNLLSAAMLFVLGLHPEDIASPGSATPPTEIDRVLLFAAVAILAPIGEEIFFRGFATNAWGRSLSRGSTIVRAALFFAFIHVMNTATTDIGLFWRAAVFNFGARVPVAIALTWIYMRRRSILASGTLHAGYNGLITIISFL